MRDIPVIDAAKPLAGRRIVVTRAAEQSRALTVRLEELGATVIALPTIAFAEPLDNEPLDAAIAALSTFHWLLFTSANAAHFFARRCRARGAEPKSIQSGAKLLFVAAVGPATSEAAAAEGFMVGHMAEEFQGVELAQELSAEVFGKKVLLPRSDQASDDLPAALRKAGAYVTEVIAYRTVACDTASPEAVAAVRNGEIDVISFFSSSAFHSLAERVGREALRRSQLAAIGPVTAAAIREAGLPIAIEATKATSESFVAALMDYFSVRCVPGKQSS
ncbi:MAG TPA: uroporphyrinogen-III synthase [Candidatus Acidoferrum sp.]|nr:uroporphyrinogen-III synthase [Candidatus Acidoferrum sp.]